MIRSSVLYFLRVNPSLIVFRLLGVGGGNLTFEGDPFPLCEFAGSSSGCIVVVIGNELFRFQFRLFEFPNLESPSSKSDPMGS